MRELTKAIVVLALLASNAVAQHEEIVRGELGPKLDAIYTAAEADGFAGAHVQTGDDGTSGYGYGMSVATSLRGTPVAGHTGGNGVFSAVLRVDKDTVLIGMTNVSEISSLFTSDVYDVLFPSDDQQEEE